MCKGITVFIVSILLSSIAFSDVVQFKNGDRITGKIVQMHNNKVTIKTSLAGEIKVDLVSIDTFSSDENLEIHLKDGSVLKQSVDTDRAGRIKLAGSNTLAPQLISITDVNSINPPKPQKPKWKGEITAGVSQTNGNTNNEAYNASFKATKRTKKDRTTFDGDLAKKKEDTGSGTEETTEDWWRAGGKYDYFFTKKLYGYGEGIYETDKIAELDRRIILGGGAGYQWIESDGLNFATEAGLANVSEKYENASGTDEKFSARLGYNYDQKFNKVFSIIHSLSYFPDTSDFADYYLTSTAELRAKINSHLFTNFKVYFDYDATPATGQKATDTKYIFGLGINF